MQSWGIVKSVSSVYNLHNTQGPLQDVWVFPRDWGDTSQVLRSGKWTCPGLWASIQLHDPPTLMNQNENGDERPRTTALNSSLLCLTSPHKLKTWGLISQRVLNSQTMKLVKIVLLGRLSLWSVTPTTVFPRSWKRMGSCCPWGQGWGNCRQTCLREMRVCVFLDCAVWLPLGSRVYMLSSDTEAGTATGQPPPRASAREPLGYGACCCNAYVPSISCQKKKKKSLDTIHKRQIYWNYLN